MLAYRVVGQLMTAQLALDGQWLVYPLHLVLVRRGRMITYASIPAHATDHTYQCEAYRYNASDTMWSGVIVDVPDVF